MSDVVERVARAIADVGGGHLDDNINLWKAEARAAIQALADIAKTECDKNKYCTDVVSFLRSALTQDRG